MLSSCLFGSIWVPDIPPLPIIDHAHGTRSPQSRSRFRFRRQQRRPARPVADPPEETPRRAAARKGTASPRVRKVRQRDGAGRGGRVRILGRARRRPGRRVAAERCHGQHPGHDRDDRRHHPGRARSTTSSAARWTRFARPSAGPMLRTGRSIRRNTPWSSRSSRGGSTTSSSGIPAPRGSAKGRGSTAGPGGSATCSSSRTSASCAIAAALRWPAGPGSDRESPCRSSATARSSARWTSSRWMPWRSARPGSTRCGPSPSLPRTRSPSSGQAGRADPDHADGRERAGQHDVRRSRPEDPVHEPAGREDAQEAGSPPADEGRSDDRPDDRHVPQAARASAAAAGRPAQPAANSDDPRRPRVLRAVGQRDGRSERPVHRPDDHLGGRDREARGQGPRGGAGRQHHGGQPVAPGPGPGPDGPRRDHRGPGDRSARRSAGPTGRTGRSSPRNRRCGSLTTRARSARTSAASRPRRDSARERGSTARPGRRGTWSSCPTWAR